MAVEIWMSWIDHQFEGNGASCGRFAQCHGVAMTFFGIICVWESDCHQPSYHRRLIVTAIALFVAGWGYGAWDPMVGIGIIIETETGAIIP